MNPLEIRIGHVDFTAKIDAIAAALQAVRLAHRDEISARSWAVLNEVERLLGDAVFYRKDPALFFERAPRPDRAEIAIASGQAMPLPTPDNIARQICENVSAFWERKTSFEVFSAKARELWKLAGRDSETLAAVAEIVRARQ